MTLAKTLPLAGIAALTAFASAACTSTLTGDEFAAEAPLVVSGSPLRSVSYVADYAQDLQEKFLGRYRTELDVTGNIGKRYRRQDEIGTPYCVTFDFDSLEDNAVTVRERDSMAQERIPIEGLRAYLDEKVLG